MEHNLEDQTTENSTGEGKTPASYTDPNAGYTEADPQTENGSSVPKEAADDKLKQEETEHPAYTYGEMPKSDPGSSYGQPEQGQSTYHSGASDGTYENSTYNNNAYNGNSYQNGTGQGWAYTNGYSNNQYQNGGYHTGFNANGYNNSYNGQNSYQNNYQMPQKQLDPSPLSMGEWLLTLIVGVIPCAGLILYIIWAFSNSGNLNRRNYCRASLILQVISYVLVIFFVIIAAIGGGVSYYGY